MNEIIKSNHLDNLGGILKLWYIPITDVANMTRPIQGYGGISLSTNKVWLKIYSSPESASYSFDFKSGSKGSFYDCVIKGVFPKQNEGSDYYFRQMIDQPFICKVLDANGKYYIVGTKDCPLRFAYGFDSGKKPADRNSIGFIFAGKIQYAPFFITSEAGSQD